MTRSDGEWPPGLHAGPGDEGENPGRWVVYNNRKAIPMKNTKRMIAVIAASGLALGTMPGVANAQGGSTLLDLGLGTELLGGSVDLGVDLFVGSTGAEGGSLEAGSLEGVTGSLEGGSADGGSLEAGSLAEGSGEGGSLEAGSLAEGSGEGGSLTGLLAAITAGSANGSMESGSLEPGSLDAASAEGSLEAGSLAEGSGEGGSLEAGSLAEGSGEGGSLEAGSLTGLLAAITAGSGEGGSLEAGSLAEGSSELGSGDLNLGSIISGSEGGAGSDAGTLLALGSLAAAGIGIGLVVSGGVNLPPLPAINVGIVCNLPQEAIDFLKDNGSMQQEECEPEEEQN
ncbi:MAG: hypothetical protein ACK40Z_03145 [Dietzia sp.]